MKDNNKEKQSYIVHTTSSYNSIFLGENKTINGKSGNKAIPNLVSLLSDPQNRMLKEQVLNELKKANGKNLLLQAISENKKKIGRAHV